MYVLRPYTKHVKKVTPSHLSDAELDVFVSLSVAEPKLELGGFVDVEVERTFLVLPLELIVSSVS